MNEMKSTGNWPAKSIADINHARIKLQEGGRFDDFYLVGSPWKIKCLDALIPDTTTTYSQFLLRNTLIKEMIEVESTKNHDDVLLVWYKVSFSEDLEASLEVDTVKITNIICQSPAPPKTLTNDELLERLKEPHPPSNVISEATLRMFRSLQGSAKE